jgi:hypothetical protein
MRVALAEGASVSAMAKHYETNRQTIMRTRNTTAALAECDGIVLASTPIDPLWPTTLTHTPPPFSIVHTYAYTSAFHHTQNPIPKNPNKNL